MKERPILMSAPMVRAILSGMKTQTRRTAKPRRNPSLLDGSWADSYVLDPGNAEWLMRDNQYGQPGERLWVREAWHTVDGDHVFYRADYAHDPAGDREHGIRWKPSIHMPRAFSRILLEIVAVRVERLQDISAEDAIAEGISISITQGFTDINVFRAAYRDLWESINGSGSWAANPWVWVVEFRRMS